MKILILAFSLILSVKGFCSWPAQTLSASTIAKDPSSAVAPYLKGVDEVYLTASDYRGVTLTFHPTRDEVICSIPVAYYEVASWLSGGREDNKRDGWSQRPSSGLKNIHSDVGSLMGILDEGSIKSRRFSTVRSDLKTKDVRAVWNDLEFSIPSDKLSKLYAFLREYYGDYPPDTQVYIYLKVRVEQAGADQPATKPADKVPAEVQPPPPTSKDNPR
jgi:hypothetical protein